MWKDTIERWLEGLVRVSVSGDMNIKTNINIDDVINYRNPRQWVSGATASNSANFLNSLIPTNNGTYRIITHVSVYNNNRICYPQIWYIVFDPTVGAFPLPEGSASRDKAVWGDAMNRCTRPIVLPPGCGLQIRDNAYQAGDTCYFNVLYHEVIA